MRPVDRIAPPKHRLWPPAAPRARSERGDRRGQAGWLKRRRRRLRGRQPRRGRCRLRQTRARSLLRTPAGSPPPRDTSSAQWDATASSDFPVASRLTAAGRDATIRSAPIVDGAFPQKQGLRGADAPGVLACRAVATNGRPFSVDARGRARARRNCVRLG